MDGPEMRDDPAVARMRGLVRSVDAPPALARAWRRTRARRAARHRRLRALAAGAGAAAVLAALVAVLVVVLMPAGGSPSVLDAAALADRGPAAPAPAADPADPDALARDVEGVAFPSWSGGGVPWRASGERSDALGGRRAVTVYYAGPGGVAIAYTIVGGPALDWPAGARRAVWRGVEVRLLRAGDTVVATWRKAGHQCVISAPSSVPDEVMLRLAASTGGAGAGGRPRAYEGGTAQPG